MTQKSNATSEPALRPFNALERYRVIEHQVGRDVDPALRASAALRQRIGVSRRKQIPDEAAVSGAGAQEAAGITPAPAPDTMRSAVLSDPVAHPVPDEHAGAAEESRGETRRPASERFPAASAVEPGDVVVIDPGMRGAVRRSDRQEDRTVVGIALTTPHGGWVEVALGSVAMVRVDAAYGAIRAGDLLVSSPAPGAAMRATAAEPGTIVGKALEPLESGLGTIRVLVTLR